MFKHAIGALVLLSFSGCTPKVEVGQDGKIPEIPFVKTPDSAQAPQPQPSPVPAHPAPTAGLEDFKPSIGEFVEYTGSQREYYSSNGQGSDGLWVLYTAVDGVPNGYTYASKVWSTAAFRELMSSCNTSDKTVDYVQTPAGVFETCRVESSKSVLWYGNVPIFGLVKQEMKGTGAKLQLVRYELGMHPQGLE